MFDLGMGAQTVDVGRFLQFLIVFSLEEIEIKDNLITHIYLAPLAPITSSLLHSNFT